MLLTGRLLHNKRNTGCGCELQQKEAREEQKEREERVSLKVL